MRKLGTLAERFFRHFEKTDGCWNWQGAMASNGYGVMFSRDGGKRHLERVHRVSWEVHNGPIENGLFVLHRCDNRRCVRPDHLFLGTQAENLKDCREKNRWHKPPTLRGRDVFGAKLTEDQVREIREKYVPRKIPLRYFSEKFGVTMAAIHLVLKGRNWKHLS